MEKYIFKSIDTIPLKVLIILSRTIIIIRHNETRYYYNKMVLMKFRSMII